MYFMRAYLENLLGFGHHTQKSQLSCALWRLDDKLDEADANYGTAVGAATVYKNTGAGVRRETLMKHGKIELSGKIHCDMFFQDKPLVTGVEMQVKMSRSRTSFSFCAPDDAGLPSVYMRNPRLLIQKYIPSAAYLNSVAKTLLTRNVKYHYPRVTMRNTTFAAGLQSATWNNLVCGQLPKTMWLVLTTSSGFNGSATESPYNFKHFDLAYVSAEIDGVLYPSSGYNMDFTTSFSLQAYVGLLDTLERLNEPTGELPFDRANYEKGFTIYGFDLTPSHTGQGALSLIQNGNLNINFRYKNALTVPVVAVAYMTFDNCIQINNNRQIIFDFAP
jgi:hypothetical protein